MDLPYEIIGMICELLWKPWRAQDFASMLIVSKVTNFACRHSAAFIEFIRAKTRAITNKEVLKNNAIVDVLFYGIPDKVGYTPRSYYSRKGYVVYYEFKLSEYIRDQHCYLQALRVQNSNNRYTTILEVYNPYADVDTCVTRIRRRHLMDIGLGHIYNRVVNGFTSEYLCAYGYKPCLSSVVKRIRNSKDLYNMMLVGKYAHHICKLSLAYSRCRAKKWNDVHQELLYRHTDAC